MLRRTPCRHANARHALAAESTLPGSRHSLKRAASYIHKAHSMHACNSTHLHMCDLDCMILDGPFFTCYDEVASYYVGFSSHLFFSFLCKYKIDSFVPDSHHLCLHSSQCSVLAGMPENWRLAPRLLQWLCLATLVLLVSHPDTLVVFGRPCLSMMIPEWLWLIKSLYPYCKLFAWNIS